MQSSEYTKYYVRTVLKLASSSGPKHDYTDTACLVNLLFYLYATSDSVNLRRSKLKNQPDLKRTILASFILMKILVCAIYQKLVH